MAYIISQNKTTLQSINKRINDYMKVKDKKYNATQWGIITKHQSENSYTLDLGRLDDERNPFDNLNNLEKSQLIKKLPDGWIKKAIL